MNRPTIICHMASSVDGRILGRRWSSSAEGALDTWYTEYERAHDVLDGDAWLVGRTTMEEFTKGKPQPGFPTTGIGREPYVADRSAKNFAIGLDSSGKLHWGTSTANGNHTVAVLTNKVSDEYLAELRADGVSYLIAGETELDLPKTLNILYEVFGIRRLLLEGGGLTNGTFLEAGLVDELSLLLAPAVDGLADSSAVFHVLDGRTTPPPVSLTLKSVEALAGGLVWMRYSFTWKR